MGEVKPTAYILSLNGAIPKSTTEIKYMSVTCDCLGILSSTSNGACGEEEKIPTRVSDLLNDLHFVADRDYKHTDNNFSDYYKGILDKSEGLPEALETITDAVNKVDQAVDKVESVSENPPKIIDEYW